MARTVKSTPPGGEPDPAGAGAPTAADLEAVAAAVEEALTGVRILDRALEFDDGTRADLAGTDSAGRIVLVRLANEDADRSALGVLDLLAFAHAHADLLARHLGLPRASASCEPRVVVILEPDDRVLAARLGAVSGAGLELHDLRTVKSAAGERAYLVVRAGVGAGGVRDVQSALQRFLEALAPENAELGRELCARLARLDDDLRTEASTDAVAWFYRDRPLVRLESRSGRLSGSVGADGRGQELTGRRDADALLEAALTRLMEEVGRPSPGDADADPARGEPALALLSAEEIEAFRD
jgi:hypothetical protein